MLVSAKALAHLVSLGVLEEITGRPRNKVFVYRKYLNLPEKGTER
jgi:hypothetical protein